jgi:hypothetical protein
MVDKTGLQIIGCIFGGATAVVLLVAILLVGNAIASGEAGAEGVQPRLAAISPQV